MRYLTHLKLADDIFKCASAYFPLL